MAFVIVFSVLLGVFLFANMFFMVFLSYIDYRRKRRVKNKPFISFILPTYNDDEYISKTIKSIYRSFNSPFELFVVNDASTDGTKKILNQLRKEYKFKLINNKKNLGKVVSINKVFSKTKGDIVFFVDSDMSINSKSIRDVLARFSENESLGAVSCRYKAVDEGFLHDMQNLEYGYLALFQGSFNSFSSLGLFGGFMAVRREAFVKVGKFTRSAIIEDTDMALKLNRFGWKVEQSFIPVGTHAPNNMKSWGKQKIRWGAGFMQCLLRYPDVYFRNPIFYLFSFIYFLPFIIAVTSAFEIDLLPLEITSSSFALHFFLFVFVYPLFSLPYVLINIRKAGTGYEKAVDVYPFSLFYLPILTAVYFVAFAIGFYKFFTLKDNEVGWRRG